MSNVEVFFRKGFSLDIGHWALDIGHLFISNEQLGFDLAKTFHDAQRAGL